MKAAGAFLGPPRELRTRHGRDIAPTMEFSIVGKPRLSHQIPPVQRAPAADAIRGRDAHVLRPLF